MPCLGQNPSPRVGMTRPDKLAGLVVLGLIEPVPGGHLDMYVPTSLLFSLRRSSHHCRAPSPSTTSSPPPSLPLHPGMLFSISCGNQQQIEVEAGRWRWRLRLHQPVWQQRQLHQPQSSDHDVFVDLGAGVGKARSAGGEVGDGRGIPLCWCQGRCWGAVGRSIGQRLISYVEGRDAMTTSMHIWWVDPAIFFVDFFRGTCP